MKALEKIEEDLKGIKLYFPEHKSKYIENKNLPSFVKCFNELTDKLGKIPSQARLSEYYLDNKIRFVQDKYYKFIKARLHRAYPSIVRDFHFNYLLKTYYKQPFFYSIKKDLEGTDFSVKYNSNWYYIHLLVNTYRSNRFRNKKDSRHNFENRNRHIDLILDFNDDKSKQVGDFFLYSKEHIKLLKSKIKDCV